MVEFCDNFYIFCDLVLIWIVNMWYSFRFGLFFGVFLIVIFDMIWDLIFKFVKNIRCWND